MNTDLNLKINADNNKKENQSDSNSVSCDDNQVKYNYDSSSNNCNSDENKDANDYNNQINNNNRNQTTGHNRHQITYNSSGEYDQYSSKSNYIGENNETRDRKIFVGGLGWNTNDDVLNEYFAQFGEIVEAVVIRDRDTGLSRGYGFVTFKEADSANEAVKQNRPVIDGRRTNCNLAYRGISRGRGRGSRGRSFRHNNNRGRRHYNQQFTTGQQYGINVDELHQNPQFVQTIPYFVQAPFPPQQVVYPQQFYTAPRFYIQPMPNQYMMPNFIQQDEQLQQHFLQQQSHLLVLQQEQVNEQNVDLMDIQSTNSVDTQPNESIDSNNTEKDNNSSRSPSFNNNNNN